MVQPRADPLSRALCNHTSKGFLKPKEQILEETLTGERLYMKCYFDFEKNKPGKKIYIWMAFRTLLLDLRQHFPWLASPDILDNALSYTHLQCSIVSHHEFAWCIIDIYLLSVFSVCVHAQSLSCVYSLWSHGLCLSSLLCPWDSPDKNIGVGCHFLLLGIFPTQGSNHESPVLAGGFFITLLPGKPLSPPCLSYFYLCDPQ